MGGMLICVAASVVGVDVGWQQTDDGQWEVILQIEPELLEQMLRSEELREDLITGIPPHLRGVRRYRIRIGNEKPPQEGGKLPPTELTSDREQAGGPAPTAPAPAESPQPSESEPGGAYSPPPQPGYSPPRLPFPHLKPGPGNAAAGPLGEGTSGLEPGWPSPSPAEPAQPAGADQSERPPATPGEPGVSGAPSPSGPHKLVVDPTAERLEVEPAVHLASSPSPSDSKRPAVPEQPRGADAQNPPPEPAGRPWLPLTLALLGLSGSLGANAWLLWIARDFRTRYRALVAEREPAAESR